MSRAAVVCVLAGLVGASILPPSARAQAGGKQGSQNPAAPAAVSADEPAFDSGTVDRLRQTLTAYTALQARGDWPRLSAKTGLKSGAKGKDVAALRRLLVLTGDLGSDKENGDAYDKDVAEAVKHFQARHGLDATGAMNAPTLAAMNVPVEQRIRQIKGSLARLRSFDFNFAHRYLVLNIPALTLEAVADGKVERRFNVVVGSRDHESPELTSAVNQVVLNPVWNLPLSITKNEIIPKMRRDPRYLSRMHMHAFSGDREVSPAKSSLSSDRAPNFSIRQDSGTWNALGAVKIDMPNRHAVYMHDTNNKNVFDAKYKFLSHGCARVENVRDLAAWVLQGVPGGDRAALDSAIADGERHELKVPKKIPIAWVYLTAWVKRDGSVQFRNDVYSRDEDVELAPILVSSGASATGAINAARRRAPSSRLDSR
jgi:murein L,D-transpeptidase YcbB/YkuD